VNNYGVWLDEFRALGLEHTLERQWDSAMCYFGEGKPMHLPRGYGRVSRRKLREHLLAICKEAGVQFLAGDVSSISVNPDGQSSSITTTTGVQLEAK
jgi:lycopene epsilon-cyclase